MGEGHGEVKVLRDGGESVSPPVPQVVRHGRGTWRGQSASVLQHRRSWGMERPLRRGVCWRVGVHVCSLLRDTVYTLVSTEDEMGETHQPTHPGPAQ